jgi:segregation and condensation protein B
MDYIPIDEPTEEELAAAALARRRMHVLSAVLFTSGRVVQAKELAQFFGVGEAEVYGVVESLRPALAEAGLTIASVGYGYKMVTQPDVFDEVDRFHKHVRRLLLTPPALEVLSLVAYRQPVTRLDVDAVRGVDSTGVIHGLLEKKLIKTRGRAAKPGRPFLYVTTPKFLEVFGINDISELPRVDSRVGPEAAAPASPPIAPDERADDDGCGEPQDGQSDA